MERSHLAKTKDTTGTQLATMLATAGHTIAKGASGTRSILDREFGNLPEECLPQGSDFTSIGGLSPRIEYKTQLCKDIAQQLGATHILTTLDEIISHSSAPLYQVLLVGRYSTGKSSILNSLLGRKVLPEGTIPTTKTITWLLPGEDEFIITEDSEGQLLRLPIENLHDEQPDNPLNQKEKIYVSLNHPLLRSGVALIDTPGLEDPDLEASQKTIKTIDTADAVIFVMDTYVASNDKAFLKSLVDKGKAHRLFVVVNKMDVVPKEERKDFFDERLQLLNEIGIAANIFPFSAREPEDFDVEHDSFRCALGAFMENGMTEARSHSIESRVDSVLEAVENSCNNLLALHRQSTSERERISQRMQADLSALDEQRRKTLLKIQRELDNIERTMMTNWQMRLRSMQCELIEAIDGANAAQLKRRDFIESRIIGQTYLFLSEEAKRAADQIEAFTKSTLEEMPLLLPENAFCLSEGEGKGIPLSVSPQLLTAGLLVCSWPVMGFFSWIQLAVTAILGRSLLEGFFASLTSHIEVTKLRQNLKEALEQQWASFDNEIRAKITEIRKTLQEHVEQVVETSGNQMTGEARALTSALQASETAPSPEKLKTWLDMVRSSR